MMRRRDHRRDQLPNPYASGIGADGDRAGTTPVLFVGAVAVGAVVGGVLTVSGTAAAEEAPPGSVTQDSGRHEHEGPGRGSGTSPGAAPVEHDGAGTAGPVTPAEAQAWRTGWSARGEEFSAGFDERIAAIRTALRGDGPAPTPTTPLPATSVVETALPPAAHAAGPLFGGAVVDSIAVRAEVEDLAPELLTTGRPLVDLPAPDRPGSHTSPALAGLREVGASALTEEIEVAHDSFRLSLDGILDLASSLARTAAGVDADAGGTGRPDGGDAADAALVSSPAFQAEPSDERTEGRALLDRGEGWLTRMLGDARAHLDEVLDPIEDLLGIPGGPVGSDAAPARSGERP